MTAGGMHDDRAGFVSVRVQVVCACSLGPINYHLRASSTSNQKIQQFVHTLAIPHLEYAVFQIGSERASQGQRAYFALDLETKLTLLLRIENVN